MIVTAISLVGDDEGKHRFPVMGIMLCNGWGQGTFLSWFSVMSSVGHIETTHRLATLSGRSKILDILLLP